jgi:hypothetical protein
MIPTASTTAYALHDLALATSFGGSLFGRFALHPAMGCVSDAQERGTLIDTAWRRFSLVNILSHGVFAATWLVGRHMLTGREIDRRTRTLVAVKDGLVATAVVTGIASIAAGATAIRDEDGAPRAVPPHGDRWSERPQPVATKVSSVAGIINLVALAGVVGVTAVLSMKAGSSHRWPLVSRLLP